MIRALCTAILLTAATPAVAAQAPLPFQFFCGQYPAECRGGGASQVALTDEAIAVLKAVNARVNRSISPRRDRGDEWALNPSAGDCEDYAVSKRHALIAAGFPASALRFGIGQLASGENHAVLVVMTDAGAMVLDNLTSAIKPASQASIRIASISGANPLSWGRL